MAPKDRLDQILLARGLADSRARAQALILAGRVYSGDRRLEKAGERIAADIPVAIRGEDHPWVSRGGQKLDHALRLFEPAIEGCVALDIGASTGGFSDVLLTRGVARLHAVDVGHGQLAWKLRQDPRLILHERKNARHLTRADIADPIDLIVCDASFISLKTILPAPLALAKDRASLIALIKPQFEAGKGRVGKKGVVADPDLRADLCAGIADWLERAMAWRVRGLAASPILGPEGNREFLIFAERGP